MTDYILLLFLFTILAVGGWGVYQAYRAKRAKDHHTHSAMTAGRPEGRDEAPRADR